MGLILLRIDYEVDVVDVMVGMTFRTRKLSRQFSQCTTACLEKVKIYSYFWDSVPFDLLEKVRSRFSLLVVQNAIFTRDRQTEKELNSLRYRQTWPSPLEVSLQNSSCSQMLRYFFSVIAGICLIAAGSEQQCYQRTLHKNYRCYCKWAGQAFFVSFDAFFVILWTSISAISNVFLACAIGTIAKCT